MKFNLLADQKNMYFFKNFTLNLLMLAYFDISVSYDTEL